MRSSFVKLLRKGSRAWISVIFVMMAVLLAAVTSALMRLSFGVVVGGLLELAVPFHSAPGVEEFHTNPEFHVNVCGMGPELAGNAVGLAMVFLGEDSGLRR